MSLKKTKINSLQVKAAPKWGGEDSRPPRGADLFSTVFFSAFFSAKKKSGKTSNLFFTLSRIISRETKLIIFCSTVHKDPTWVFMVKYFKSKGIEVETHLSVKEDGIDLLGTLVKELEIEFDPGQESEEEEEEEEVDPKEILKQKGNGIMKAILEHNLSNEQQQQKGKGKKEKKSKYRERKYIVVLDDISSDLKSKSLVSLLKNHRHFEMAVLISSQYYLDILPESRMQLDYFLIYKGQTEEKLKAIYHDADLDIEYDKFKELYDDATKDPYSFLYVDARNCEFRKNYNEKYNL